MPYTIKSRVIVADVEDVEPLENVNNPDEPKFVPKWAHITLYPDSTRAMVTGPLLNPKGMPYKTKTGMAMYDNDDFDEGTAPQWLVQLLTDATGTEWG